jgi:hypothetical protein
VRIFLGDNMTAPTKVNYKVYQGSTFNEVLRWESYIKNYVTISNITKTAPAIITAVGHEIPTGWRFKVSGVQGMKEINSDEYLVATSTDTDTITVNLLNSTGYSPYTSGGIIEYYSPKALTGLTARMQIRAKITDSDTILELTTENGGIVLDDIAKTIAINITATQTTLLTFKTAVYSLEILSGSTVTTLLKGNLTLENEITR